MSAQPLQQQQQLVLSDDDEYDELASGDELEREDRKPDTGPFSGSIRKPRHVTTSCKQLHDMIHQGGVELNPPYQRDVVWPEAKMIGLISSLYLNYYIPPIIFAFESDPSTGEERRICIDGKQRCSSIVDFMDGNIPFVSPITGERFWYKKIKPHSKGAVCTAAMRNKFDMIQIQAVEYESIADEIQRDIFQRVQMGVPLSAAEKLQAIPSELTSWIMELLKKYVLEEGTLSEMNWDVSRGRPFQAVASMVWMCWYTENTKAVSSTVLKGWLERSEPLDEGFKRKMDAVMALLVNISVHYSDIAFHVAGFKPTKTQNYTRVSPVELWFMGYLVYLRMGSSSLLSIARQIGKMRKDIRAKYKDIFTNGAVVGTLYTWVSKLPVEKPGPNEQVAAVDWEGQDPISAMSVAKKRKLEQREQEEDPDYRGGAGGSSSRTRGGGATSASGAKTRKIVNAPTGPNPNRPAAPSSPPAVRPSLSGMDAAPGSYQQPGPAQPHDYRQQQRSSHSIYGNPQAPTQPAAYGQASQAPYRNGPQASYTSSNGYNYTPR